MKRLLLLFFLITTTLLQYGFSNPGDMLWTFEADNWIATSPAVDNENHVFISSRDFKVYGIDAQNGSKIWEYTNTGITTNDKFAHLMFDVEGSVLVHTHSPERNLILLEPSDGNVAGSIQLDTLSSGTEQPGPAVDFKNDYVIPTNYKEIKHFNKDISDSDWSRKLEYQSITSPAINQKGQIFVGSNLSIHCISATNNLVWSKKFGSSITSNIALSDNGNLYFGCGNGDLVCLSQNDGSIEWTYSAGYSIYSTPVISSDQKVIFGTDEGAIHCLSENDGNLQWKYLTDDVVKCTGLISDENYYYVGDEWGWIYCIDVSTGTEVWNYEAWDSIRAPLAMTPDGKLIVASLDNTVYALATGASGLANSPWPKHQGDIYSSGRITLTPDNPPSDLSASMGEFSSGVMLSWSEREVATGYSIFRSTVTEPDNATPIATVYGASQYFDDSTIDGTDYFYWITTDFLTRKSQLSSSVSGNSKTAVLEKPTLTSIQETLSGNLTIQWGPIDNATEYRVFRSGTDNFSGSELIGTSASTEITDVEVGGGINYNYWVQAINAEGEISLLSDAKTGFLMEGHILPSIPIAFEDYEHLAGLSANEGGSAFLSTYVRQVPSWGGKAEITEINAGAFTNPQVFDLANRYYGFKMSHPVVFHESGILIPNGHGLARYDEQNDSTSWYIEDQSTVWNESRPALGIDGTILWNMGHQLLLFKTDESHEVLNFEQYYSNEIELVCDEGVFLAKINSDTIGYDYSGNRRWVISGTDTDFSLAIDRNFQTFVARTKEDFNLGEIHTLSAINLETGIENWTITSAFSFAGTPVVTNSGELLASRGDRHLVSIDTATGEILWTFDIGFIPLTATIGNNNIVYCSDSNNIAAVDIESGTVLWIHKTKAIVSQPLISNEGELLILLSNEIVRISTEATNAAKTPWPTYLGNQQRTGCSSPLKVPTVEIIEDFSEGILLNWTSSPKASSYRILRNTINDIKTATLIENEVKGLYFSDDTAILGQNYYYWVQAFNATGSGETSQVISGVLEPGLPLIPSFQSCTRNGDTGIVTLTWGPVDGASVYKIFRSSDSDFAQNVEFIGQTASLSINDSSLEPDEEAYYWLVAISSTGSSSYMGDSMFADNIKPALGELVWSFRTGGSLAGVIPAISEDNVIVFGSDDGRIYALDAETGRRKWRVSSGGSRISPVIIDSENMVILGENAYNMENGSLLWSLPTDQWGGFQGLLPPIYDNNGHLFYIVGREFSFPEIHCYNTSDGTLQWDYLVQNINGPDENMYYQRSSPLSFDKNGNIIASFSDDYSESLDQIVCLNPTNGVEVWKHYFEGEEKRHFPVGPFSLNGETIVIQGDISPNWTSRAVYFDSDTGLINRTVDFARPFRGTYQVSYGVFSGDSAIIDEQNNIYLPFNTTAIEGLGGFGSFNLDTGNLNWAYYMDDMYDTISSGILTSRGSVFFNHNDQLIKCANGNLTASWDIPHDPIRQFQAGPILSRNGLLIQTSETGDIVAYRVDESYSASGFPKDLANFSNTPSAFASKDWEINLFSTVDFIQNGVEIRWDPIGYPATYEIYRGGSNGSIQFAEKIAETTINHFKDEGILTDSNYYYWVKTKDSMHPNTMGTLARATSNELNVIKWSLDFPSSISPLAVGNENHVLLESNKILYCISGDTGEIFWNINIGGISYDSATIIDDFVYMISYESGTFIKTLHCIDLRTGITQWSKQINDYVAPVPISENEIALSQYGSVRVLNRIDGNEVKTISIPDTGSLRTIRGLNNGDTLVAETYTGELFKLTASSYEIEHIGNIGKPYRGFSLDVSGDIFVGARDTHFRRFNGRDLTVEWEQELNGYDLESYTLIDERLAYSINRYRINALDKFTGELQWTVDTDSNACPVLDSENSIYHYTNDGTLMRIDCAYGYVTWHNKLYSNTTQNGWITMGTNGILYVATSDNRLHAITSEAPSISHSAWAHYKQTPWGWYHQKSPYSEFQNWLGSSIEQSKIIFEPKSLFEFDSDSDGNSLLQEYSFGGVDGKYDFTDREMTTDSEGKTVLKLTLRVDPSTIKYAIDRISNTGLDQWEFLKYENDRWSINNFIELNADNLGNNLWDVEIPLEEIPPVNPEEPTLIRVKADLQ